MLPDRWTFVAGTNRLVEGNFSDICDALTKYQSGTAPRINELYIVYKEVKDWLKKNKPGIISTKNANIDYAVASGLHGEVITELNQADPGLGDALLNLDLHNSQNGQITGPKTKLATFYKLERKTYTEGRKLEAPFSASRVERGIQTMGANLDRAGWNQLTSPQALANHPIPKMYFMNKIQRLKKRVTLTGIGPNVRWVDFNNQLAVSRHSDPSVLIAQAGALQAYAMDRYGNIFVDYENASYGILFMNKTNKTADKAATNARGMLNHSSFVAGREVICAGNIYFWKGQLIHIDNNSGHYKPDRNALHRAVEVLRDLGAELNYLRVAFRAATGMQAFKANTFLANGQPDWPNQNIGSGNVNHMPHFKALLPLGPLRCE